MFPATLSPLFVGSLLLIAPQPIDVQVINAADDTVNAAPNDERAAILSALQRKCLRNRRLRVPGVALKRVDQETPTRR